MKPLKLAMAGLFVLILLVSSPTFASSGGNDRHSQPLSLTLQGMITNAGSQHYELSGGSVIQGSINGAPVTQKHISFDLEASVQGAQGATGRGSIQISSGHDHGNGGDDEGSGDNSRSSGSSFSARISVTGVIPAAIFPITLVSPTLYANCDPASQHCNSEIPLFFTGVASIGSGGGDPVQMPIAVESPYWNPFGGPILIISLDSPTNPSIFLVVSYTEATIDWNGVQLAGSLAGTYGAEPVTGAYAQTTNSHEDLVGGREFDSGTIAFLGMSDQTLNAQGRFAGRTSFSLAGSFDCAPEFSLPEGTCTATGATSTGGFLMSADHKVLITGTYSTIWSVPSLFTQTTVMGAVIQH